jgi:16S rRNA (guanine527-N7)-methyltransferase
MLSASDAENFLAQGLSLMGLSLGKQPEALARLSLYYQELKKWNRKINLVARSLNDKEILENHFLDSLTLLSLLPPEIQEQETVLDVGTGAGFPGLVLKTVCPALHVTLIEPRKNRFYFLKHIARTLNLKEIEVLEDRLEPGIMIKELSSRGFSFITSRAFTDVYTFLKLAEPYLEEGGRIVLMKGPGAVAELNDPGRKETNVNFSVAGAKKLYLPFSDKERWLVSIRRSGKKKQ